MAQLKITSRMRSSQPDIEESFTRRYDSKGILHEERVLSKECDYACGAYSRTSEDKGKTWSDWVKHFDDDVDGRRMSSKDDGNHDEYTGGGASPSLYHPQSGCYFGVATSIYYINGHDVGYFDYWEKGEDNVRFHGYYAIKYPDGRVVNKMFELEEGGCDYDPKNPRNPAFLDKNRCGAGNLQLLPDGDLCFFLEPTVTLCCKMAGVDVNTYFPSSPNFSNGLVVVRAHWNAEKGDFEFTYSNPIMLSDVQSSRCVMESHMAILPNGRWLIVTRGSNMTLDVWNTRISPSAPGFKWYTYSDDGGKTFAPLMPWHFDTREVIYSSASVHSFYRSPKNGKLYWLGNIIDPPAAIDGNNPRYPLYICQVDEEVCCLMKDTLTVIDSLREGQTGVELSNFNLLEDPDTKNVEIRLTKTNFNGKHQEEGYWYSEAWEYFIEFPEKDAE